MSNAPTTLFSDGGKENVDFRIPGGRMGQDEFDEFLLWCNANKVSDVTIESGQPVVADMGGRLRRVILKKVSHNEVSDVLRGIYGDNGPGMVNAGQDLDFAYEFKRKPADISHALVRSRFRVNVTCVEMQGGRGFQMTIRTLPSQPIEISQLGIEPEIMENFRPPQGLNLITGPTGSGKSTLLSSLIRWRCEQEGANEKVIEFSSPIEYVYRGLDFPDSIVSASEPGDHLRASGHGADEVSPWAYAVRNALRRKPTAIVIGEARDRETIQGCIEGALTGHLVISSMHTIGVPETVRRAMMPFSAQERRGIAVDLLECLNLVVTQLLLPKVGGGRVGCREFMVIDRKVRATLSSADPDEWQGRLREMMNERRVVGSTMAQSAKKLLGEGLISPDTYEWIAARTSGEAKVLRDAQGAGLLSRAAALGMEH